MGWCACSAAAGLQAPAAHLPRHLLPSSLLQYLGAVLLVAALRRSRVSPHLLLPTATDLRALLRTFGVLTVFYACKNLCYVLLQV